MIARDYAFEWYCGESKLFAQNANRICITSLSASVTHVTRDL